MGWAAVCWEKIGLMLTERTHLSLEEAYFNFQLRCVCFFGGGRRDTNSDALFQFLGKSVTFAHHTGRIDLRNYCAEKKGLLKASFTSHTQK